MPRAAEQAPLLAHSDGDGQPHYGSVAAPHASSSADDSAPAPSAHGEADVPFPPLRVLLPLLFTIWVPVFAASLDGTVVATLVGSIASDFEASEQAAWLGSSYLLSVCCFTPIYGRLCDILGRRRALLTALSFFVVGTFGCGMAQSMGQLIAARGLAGVGGGGLAVVNSTIMSDVIPLRHRGLMQGLTNIIFGLGSGLGGPVGGFANDKLGWRSAFMLQMPILGVALVAALFVPLSPPNQAPKPSPLAGLSWTDKLLLIDGLGSLFLVGAVGSSLISLSLMSAQDLSFSEPVVWGGLVAGAASAVAFVCVELWVARKPILPIPLLLQRTGGSVALANFALAAMSFALLYNFPLWFQTVKLQSASEAGLHLIPNSVALSVSSVTAGLYMRWRGVYWAYNLVHAGLMLAGSLIVLSLRADTPEWLTYAGIVPSGLGVSGVLTCTLIALINSVPREDIAVATAMSYLFRTSGQVVGVALSGAILQAKLRTELEKRIKGHGAAKTIAAIRHQSSIIPTLPAHERAAAVAAYSVALRWVFGFVAAAALVTLLSCITIENRQLPEYSKGPSGDAEQPADAEET